jgi:hypothetical protein
MSNVVTRNKFFGVALIASMVFAGMTFGNLPSPIISQGIQEIDGEIFNFADYPALTHEQIAILNYFDSLTKTLPYNSWEGWHAERYSGLLHYFHAFASYLFATVHETTPGYRTDFYQDLSYTMIKKMNTTVAEYGNESIEYMEWNHFTDYYYPDYANPDADDLYMGGFRGPANIMWTGHYALMLALYERNFNTGELTDELSWYLQDWNTSLTTDGFGNPQDGGIWHTGLIPCEPYIVFVQCNSIPIFTTELYDNMMNTSYMEDGVWDYGLNFIEEEMTDEYGLYTDGYYTMPPMGYTPIPGIDQPFPGPSMNRELGGPKLSSYGLAWALTFLEYTQPEVTIPDYPLFLDLYGNDVSGNMMFMDGSYRNPGSFGDIIGILGTLFGTVLANQRGDYATRDRLLNFMHSLYNKVWSDDGRTMYYDTSALEPFLQMVLSGFTVWATVPVTMMELADVRPAEFWDYPYISSADDDNIWVYQAEWDSHKSAFILNVRVDSLATLAFSNFDSTPTAYSSGLVLSQLVPAGGDYTLTLQPGTYQLVITTGG